MIDKILEKYEQYTGITLSPEQRKMYVPYVMRAIAMLENKLGWPLDGGTDVATVLGVSPSGCNCRTDAELKDAPTKVGIYRVFPVDSRVPNILIDPFKRINAVYLARIVLAPDAVSANDEVPSEPSEDPQAEPLNKAIILQTMTAITPVFQSTYGRYVKACAEISACQQACNPNCTNCAVLLVDADWLTIDDLPASLFYLICDYINWVADGGLDSRSVRSESVDGHSVSYGSWLTTAPYYHTADNAIIKGFLGPYGSANRKMIR